MHLNVMLYVRCLFMVKFDTKSLFSDLVLENNEVSYGKAFWFGEHSITHKFRVLIPTKRARLNVFAGR